MKDKTLEDKIKKAVADEFKYRASQGRTNYSMEEAIYIVSEVIHEVFAWEATLNGDMESRTNQENIDSLRYLEIQMRVIKGDLKCLADKVSLLEERDKMPIPKFVEDKPYTDKSVQSGFGIPVGNNGYTPV